MITSIFAFLIVPYISLLKKARAFLKALEVEVMLFIAYVE